MAYLLSIYLGLYRYCHSPCESERSIHYLLRLYITYTAMFVCFLEAFLFVKDQSMLFYSMYNTF